MGLFSIVVNLVFFTIMFGIASAIHPFLGIMLLCAMILSLVD